MAFYISSVSMQDTFSCILDEHIKEICHFKRHKSSLFPSYSSIFRGSEMTYKWVRNVHRGVRSVLKMSSKCLKNGSEVSWSEMSRVRNVLIPSH